jgi:DNA-binding CsgD family transcriptional regulator
VSARIGGYQPKTRISPGTPPVGPAGASCANHPVSVAAPYLTPAEKRVVAEIARGGGYQDIAVRLGLAVETIKTTRGRAMRHIGATTTPHLVALAIAHRLIPAGTALPAGGGE